MKKWVNAKNCLAAAAFAVVVLIAGAITLNGTTFALLADTASVPGKGFKTANLEMIYTSTKTYVKEFQRAPDVFQVQKELDESLKSGDRETVFSEWLEEHFDAASLFTDTKKASRSSIVFREYTLQNTSNIPVYFRIERAELSAKGSRDNPDYILAAFYNIGNGDKIALIAGEDDYFYSAEPLASGDTITVTFAAYIISIDGGEHTLSAKSAEIIQVPNNATYFSDGWKDVADKLNMGLTD